MALQKLFEARKNPHSRKSHKYFKKPFRFHYAPKINRSPASIYKFMDLTQIYLSFCFTQVTLCCRWLLLWIWGSRLETKKFFLLIYYFMMEWNVCAHNRSVYIDIKIIFLSHRFGRLNRKVCEFYDYLIKWISLFSLSLMIKAHAEILAMIFGQVFIEVYAFGSPAVWSDETINEFIAVEVLKNIFLIAKREFFQKKSYQFFIKMQSKFLISKKFKITCNQFLKKRKRKVYRKQICFKSNLSNLISNFRNICKIRFSQLKIRRNGKILPSLPDI